LIKKYSGDRMSKRLIISFSLALFISFICKMSYSESNQEVMSFPITFTTSDLKSSITLPGVKGTKHQVYNDESGRLFFKDQLSKEQKVISKSLFIHLAKDDKLIEFRFSNDSNIDLLPLENAHLFAVCGTQKAYTFKDITQQHSLTFSFEADLPNEKYIPQYRGEICRDIPVNCEALCLDNMRMCDEDTMVKICEFKKYCPKILNGCSRVTKYKIQIKVLIQNARGMPMGKLIFKTQHYTESNPVENSFCRK